MAAAFALYLRASLLDLSPEGNLPLLTAGRIKLQKAFCFDTKTEAHAIKWLDIKVSEIGQVMIEAPTVCNFIRMNLKLYYGEVLVKSMTNTPKETKYNTFINCWKNV